MESIKQIPKWQKNWWSHKNMKTVMQRLLFYKTLDIMQGNNRS